MATQTTEVNEENGVDMEAASNEKFHTTTASFSAENDNKKENNAFENKKTALKMEMIATTNETETLLRTNSADVIDAIPDDTDSKESSSVLIDKKIAMDEKNCDVVDGDEMNSYSTANTCSSVSTIGINEMGGERGYNIGSNPNLAGGDYESIPEWKKELLQRRKTKIARTIGANQVHTAICNQKDSKLTSSVTPLTKTLTNNNYGNNIINNNSSSNNSSKNSSHQITTNKILPTSNAAALITHQTTSGTTPTHSGCSTGHYTTVNSSSQSQSYNNHHQPQQICGIGLLTANTSLETKTITSSSSPQSLSTTFAAPATAISALSSPTISVLKNDGFNGSSPSSDLNNQSSTHSYTENNLKCISTSSSSSSSSNNNINGSSNNSSGTCRITSQLKQQQQSSSQNQLEQPNSTSNTSSSQEQLQQPFQLHSKHEIVKSSLSPSILSICSTASPPSTINNNIPSGSASSNNSNISFIKNPTVGKTSLNKANKYKLSAKLNSPSSNGSVVVTSNSQTKKMVAMQQMDINDSSISVDLDFDSSEELQYGPGIVSKLRCRYLSLALRQSANKQRPPLDNLRRATSLNNLLDDDDDSNNGSVIDNVDHIENNTRNNNVNTSVTTPDEFVANFQKNLKVSDKDKQRSRQLKRGNDSIKRARSVEALLGCDKSWDHVNNVNNSHDRDKTPVRQLYHRLDDASSTSSAGDVTIEEKIVHARERLSCEKTPKRLTSIIDDTERPPPDVVKQTLKIFEASANRRGRGLSRNNFSGEVAAKVASYKSIISQEKPPIVFPKPPLSPKRQFKKPNNLDITPSSKRNLTTNNSSTITSKKINPASPISNLAKKFINLEAFNEPCEKNLLTNQQSGGTISPLPTACGGHRAEMTLRHRHNFMIKNESTPIRSSFDSNTSSSPSRTPDLIPKKHLEYPLFTESLSPVTQLTKNIEKLRIDSPTQQTQSPISTQHQTNTSASNVTTTGSLVPLQRQNSEPNDSSDVSDVEELMKPVSKSTISKNNSYKDEKHKENILNKSSTSCISSSSPSSMNKPSSPIAVNGDSLIMTTTSCTTSIEQHQGQQGHHHHHQQQQQQQIQYQQSMPVKQVCVIRPLLSETSKLSQQVEKSNSLDKNEKFEKSDLCVTDALNANKTRDNLVISNLNQSGSCIALINSNQSNEQLQVHMQQQQQQQQQQRPALTSREIEKNLINEKKTEQAAIEASTGCGGGGGAKWPFMKKKSSSSSSASWNHQMAEAQNNSMVFNFKDRKEVPDYIENDGLFVKRRRELPKPNEPGFVLLGDLSLETSTDPDDAWTMGPPSPCDVEFENANILIDGKSSIRYRSREINLKVQFDDTLTSTFEYPSESSLLEDSTTFETETMAITTETATTAVITTKQITKIDEIIKAPGPKLLGNMSLDYRNGPMSIMLPQQKHNPLPPPPIPPQRMKPNNLTAIFTSKDFEEEGGNKNGLTMSPTSSVPPPSPSPKPNFGLKPPKRLKPLLLLSTVPVGSAPLGNYTPIKAQINTTFELGITRAPTPNDGCASFNTTNNGNNSSPSLSSYDTNDMNRINNTSSSSSSVQQHQQQFQQNGDENNSSMNNKNNDEILNNEPESLPYLKPATDDLTIVYSEGSQKTDLLY